MYAQDTAVIATPIGRVTVVIEDERLAGVGIGGSGAERAPSSAVAREAIAQLRQWFAGTRELFTLPLAPAATPRGQALRDAMAAIPFGETMSYGALARLAGSSPRAIGQACARNPFPIIIPCHRVLGAGGALGAYSAGDGPETKQWLLDHERRIAGGQA